MPLYINDITYTPSIISNIGQGTYMSEEFHIQACIMSNELYLLNVTRSLTECRCKLICSSCCDSFNLLCKKRELIGYEPADLTVHLPPKTIEGGFIFSHRCLVPPKFFPQRKSGFCRRYSH